MYWHGLATALALVFVPLVVLALGLMFAGRRGPRTIGLLGFGLVGVIRGAQHDGSRRRGSGGDGGPARRGARGNLSHRGR